MRFARRCVVRETLSTKLLWRRLKYPYLPPHLGRGQDGKVLGANVLSGLYLVMVQDLHVVFDRVEKLDGQSFRRVENQMDVVLAIQVEGPKPKFLLVGDCIRKFFPGEACEVCVQQMRIVFVQRVTQTAPCCQVISNHGTSGLGFERPWAYGIRIRNPHCGLFDC